MYRYLRRLELLTATLALVTMEVPVIAAEAPLTILRGSAPSVWLNSAPLDDRSLRGKIVLVDFWTYSCINSLRNLPYLEAWSRKYRPPGWWSSACTRPNSRSRRSMPTSRRRCAPTASVIPW